MVEKGDSRRKNRSYCIYKGHSVSSKQILRILKYDL